ncbi:hypothetical protein [Planomicrobium sp. CPCC 101079]|uniref:hypothetical protein n=1 Tax=Planomicrobium sp. CPCC 101079 TaxID=2599618 RepID=UPI0011B43A03|nr:hypothetical protein [Planomicrobium sp. CPCC 101079]TWT00959.1 hypothetical protein FQV28_16340 [Planomicrobium sp. CPCC 101079]
MDLIDSIDPFIMLLVIVPFVVICVGVAAAAVTKKVYIGPIATLAATLIYNNWYFSHTFPEAPIPIPMIFSWCIMFPFFSLVLSWFFVSFAGTFKEYLILITKEKSFYSK